MTLVEKTEDFLNDVIRHMKAEATVNVSEEDSNIKALIEGVDAGILIGRDGQNLDALQMITNIVVNKGQEERIRVLIDIEGYREKRKENLERLANSLAEKVTNEKRVIDLEPMNAFERRIIHMTLRESTSVMTESQGEGSERHVIIKPL